MISCRHAEDRYEDNQSQLEDLHSQLEELEMQNEKYGKDLHDLNAELEQEQSLRERLGLVKFSAGGAVSNAPCGSK